MDIDFQFFTFNKEYSLLKCENEKKYKDYLI